MSQGKTCGKRCAFLYKALTTTPLFRGYNAAEVEKICGLLKARLKHYAARAIVVSSYRRSVPSRRSIMRRVRLSSTNAWR